MKINGVFGRLIIANLAVLVFLSLFMTFIFYKTQQINTLLKRVNSVELPVIERVDRLNGLILKQVEFREKYVISGDVDFLERYEEYTNESKKIIAELKFITKGIGKDRHLNELTTAYMEFNSANGVYISSKGKGVDIPSYASVSDSLMKLRNIAAQQRKKSLRISGVLAEEIKAAAFFFIISGGILVVILAFANTRNIVNPIRKLRENTHQVAQGIYPENISQGGPREIRELAEDFSVMVRRLKENDELRAEFIGNVSHELRTPLTSIREASEMMKEDYFRSDSESSAKLLNIISTESDRLINSVNNILEITRLDIAQAVYDIKTADICAVAESAIEKTAPIAARRNISVVSDIGKGETALADAEKLAVVFANLLGNALKYSGEGTEVALSAEKKGNRLLVCVADEGIGIAQNELKTIFERYRLGSNRGTEYKGSGLGLAICRKVIENHGGEIWAESPEGQGSRFYFTLRLS